MDSRASGSSGKTQPSISSSIIDARLLDIFKKIDNDDNNLRSIPFRFDPNVEFSEDEDEPTARCSEDEDDELSAHCSEYEISTPRSLSLENISVTPQLVDRRIRERSCSLTRNAKTQQSSIAKCNVALGKGPFREKKSPEDYSSDVLRRKPSLLKQTELSTDFDKVYQSTLKQISQMGSRKTSTKASVHIDSMISGTNKNSANENSKLTLDSIVTKKESAPCNISTPSTDEIIQVNNKSYTILNILGSGGSCKVYSVLDRETKSVVAIKRVNLNNQDFSVTEGYKKEIEYLKKLQGSNLVIKMFDYEYCKEELLLVLEKGDTDLARYISNEIKMKNLTPLMIKFYWSQMLQAVAEIHNYGIIHSDLKPANFLLVAGKLKLIDFGIAAAVQPDMTSAIRDSHVGTLNYMSPEAVTCYSTGNEPENKQYYYKVGVKSDVWSLGCILYNLVYGHTPFQHIRTLYQKIQAIMDPKFQISFAPLKDLALLDVLQLCLKRDPKERASVEKLLNHPYLATEAKPSTSVSQEGFQNMFAQIQSLTPQRMGMVNKVLRELTSQKKNNN